MTSTSPDVGAAAPPTARAVVDLLLARGDQLHADLRVAAERVALADDGTMGTIVLRHSDVVALARDRRLAGVGLAVFDFMGISEGPLRDWYGGLMFTNDGDDHDRLRRLVSRAFTPRSADKLRREAAERASRAVAGVVDAGGGDLADAYSLVAMQVMCTLLGVPEDDVPVFAGWANALSPVFRLMTTEEISAATEAIVGMLDYVDDLAARRRSDPADDLISALIAAEDAGDRLTHDELLAMVANLLVGGHDTTTSQLGCSLYTLLRHPQQAQRVREGPELLPSAVEETIRLEPSIIGVPRTAVQPVPVAGCEVPAGTLLLLCTAAANREAGVWEDPDRFDVARFMRNDTPALLSFGAGPHYCLGAALARVTLQEVVRATIVRDVEMQLQDDPADIPWRVLLGRSPAALTVTVVH